MTRLALCSAAIWIGATAAFAETYYRTMTDVMSLEDSRELVKHPLKDVLLKYQAVVDTQTGKVFHPESGTSEYGFIDVPDHGSKVSSFKVISYSEEGSRPEEGVASFRNAAYFEVKTNAKGPTKPFLAVTSGYFAYGLCQ
ncbi:MAG: hypothetical protein WA784_15395 [Albidovulum sp.]